MIDRELNEAFTGMFKKTINEHKTFIHKFKKSSMKPTKSFVKDIHHFVGMLNVLDWLD